MNSARSVRSLESRLPQRAALVIHQAHPLAGSREGQQKFSAFRLSFWNPLLTKCTV